MALRDEGYRAPVLWLLLPYACGLALRAETFQRDAVGWLSLLVCCVGVGAWAAWRSPTPKTRIAWAVSIAAGGIVFGALRMAPVVREPERWRSLPPREASFEVELTRVFPPTATKRFPSALGRIRSAPPLLGDLVGQRVHVSRVQLPDGRSPLRTEVLAVSGVVESVFLDPKLVGRAAAYPGAASFNDYLISNAVFLRLTRSRVETEVAGPSWWAHAAAALGQRFASVLSAGLPQHNDAAGAYLAMFLGRKDAMSEDQRLDYLQTGAMHLFAISGLHIAVIAACMHGLLRFLRVPSLACAVAGIAALVAFVEATGGTPSARRALVMVALVWIGTVLRRPANPLASIATAALAVLLADPLALVSLSFQFSYAVVAMLLLYGAPLTNRWLDRWHPWAHLPDSEWRWRHRAVFFGGRRLIILSCTSWSAALVSTPLTVAYFGIATPGAILANLVLVPVALYSITAGFTSLLCGLCGLSLLSVVFNHAAAMILWAMNAFAHAAADWPGMYVEGSFRAAWIAPALVCGTLAICLVGYAVRWTRMPGGFLLPPAFLIGTLAFLVTPPEPVEQSRRMKSAYELAMERLQRSESGQEKPLSPEQKERLAEISRVYQGKIAEREIFLQQRLAEVQSRGELEEAEKIRKQMAAERARLEEEREDEKNRVRRST